MRRSARLTGSDKLSRWVVLIRGHGWWHPIFAAALLLWAFAAALATVPTARAAFPGAPGELVFTDGVYIFVMNADGSERVRIATGADPAWSHDGSKIVFTSGFDHYPGVFVMNSDGTGRARLTATSAIAFDGTWSPDGMNIALVEEETVNDDAEIWAMASDGSDPTQLTHNSVFDGTPAWSPDGSQIAFESLRDGNAEIYVMDAQGAGVTRLTADPEQETSPSWSPDGARIAFVSADQDGFDPEIEVMDANGSNRAPLTSGSLAPAWSPDGTKIAFFRSPGQIYVMNADGSGVTPVGVGSNPDWQPLQMTLGASKREVSYPGSVTITGHLLWFATTDNLELSLFKIPYGGTKTLVASGEVDPLSGDFAATVPLTKTTTLVAEWTGDASHLAAKSPVVTVGVHAVTKTKLSGSYGRSGIYRLYHESDSVIQTGTVIPNHAGKRLVFLAQKRNGGKWKTVATARFRIRSNGSAQATFGASRGTYRVRNIFPGDKDHLGDASPWAYLRITA